MAGMNRLAWCDGASRCESGNRAAAMLRPAPGRRSRGAAPGGALALLLALAVLALAVPSKAQASVLVSNLNQPATGGAYPPGGVGSYFQSGGTDDLAQGFTTGTNADGYTLTSIEIPFAESISAADIADLTVSIHADDGSGNPAATALFALDKPASIDGYSGSTAGVAANRAAGGRYPRVHRPGRKHHDHVHHVDALLRRADLRSGCGYLVCDRRIPGYGRRPRLVDRRSVDLQARVRSLDR